MPIPPRYRNHPRFRNRFSAPAEDVVATADAVDIEEVAAEDVGPAPEQIPDEGSDTPTPEQLEKMSYHELQKLVSAEEEQELPDKKKKTYLRFLLKKFGY